MARSAEKETSQIRIELTMDGFPGKCTIHENVHHLLCLKSRPGTLTKPVAHIIPPVVPSLVAPIMAINSRISHGKNFPRAINNQNLSSTLNVVSIRYTLHPPAISRPA